MTQEIASTKAPNFEIHREHEYTENTRPVDSNEPTESTEGPEFSEPAGSPDISDSVEAEESPDTVNSNEPVDAPENTESNNSAELQDTSAVNVHHPPTADSMEIDAHENEKILNDKSRDTIERDEDMPKSVESPEHDREPLSYEEPDAKPGDWLDIEIETNADSNKDKQPAHYNYYHKDSDEDAGDSNKKSAESEFGPPIDLSGDIAINHMLADQGAAHDPDAETFDVNLYNVDAEAFEDTSREVHTDSEPKSFDYLPYHHISTGERHSSTK